MQNSTTELQYWYCAYEHFLAVWGPDH